MLHKKIKRQLMTSHHISRSDHVHIYTCGHHHTMKICSTSDMLGKEEQQNTPISPLPNSGDRKVLSLAERALSRKENGTHQRLGNRAEFQFYEKSYADQWW